MGVYIGGSTNWYSNKTYSVIINHIATSKIELYDGNNSATGATKFYLSIDFDI